MTTTARARILVVDDERNIRTSLRIALEAAGYEVALASDGEEGLARCGEQSYAIALVDLQMPKMGGLELLRHLAAVSPQTAVVVLTAYGTVSRAVEAMKLGAVDFLEKPFDPQTIRALVEEIILRQQLQAKGSVDDLLHLAELARGRKALVEARAYLKAAVLRDATRPEPYFELGALCEADGAPRQAAHYYFMALDVFHTFEPARAALERLGHLPPEPKA